MKNKIKQLLITSLLVGSMAQAAPSKALYFTSPGGTDSVTLDHPLLNGKPKLNPIVTQVYLTNYNPHFVGLQYDTAISKWKVYTEDTTVIPAGRAFNILIPASSTRLLASPANSWFDFTATKVQAKNPAALLHCSHLYNPVPNVNGDKLPNGIGIFRTLSYSTSPALSGLWSVYNEDGSVPKAVGFSLADVTKEKINGVPNSFIFTVGSTNYLQTIINPLTDGLPNARLIVTHLYGQFHNHPFGVFYTGGYWTIFNEDLAPMVAGDKFIVSVYPATP